MEPITPLPLIEYGIAFYTPLAKAYTHLKLEIMYNQLNPLFDFVHWSTATIKIWEYFTAQTKLGTLFLYNSNNLLATGFYTFILSGYSGTGSSKSSSLMIGLTVPKDKLIIGLPYSTYSPITL